MEPSFAAGHAGLAAVLENMKRGADAEKECRKAIELDPTEPDYQIQLG